MPQRQEQHRCRIGERRGHAGKGVLRPRAVLHREHPYGVPIGDPTIPIRDADPDPLLGTDLGTDACGCARLDNGCGRETAETLDTLLLQDGGDSIDDFHRMSSISLSMAAGANRLALSLLRHYTPRRVCPPACTGHPGGGTVGGGRREWVACSEA